MAAIHAPNWMQAWLAISGILTAYDAGFVLFRPHTLEGGFLYPLWFPYKLYGNMDRIYSTERYKEGDRFCEAQSVCNVIEIVLQLSALWLMRRGIKQQQIQHSQGYTAGPSRSLVAASVLAMVAQTTTFWKTVLYWLYDALGGFAHTHHNPLPLMLLYHSLTSCWIFFPLIIVVNLSTQLINLLGNPVRHGTANGKKSS